MNGKKEAADSVLRRPSRSNDNAFIRQKEVRSSVEPLFFILYSAAALLPQYTVDYDEKMYYNFLILKGKCSGIKKERN